MCRWYHTNLSTSFLFFFFSALPKWHNRANRASCLAHTEHLFNPTKILLAIWPVIAVQPQFSYTSISLCSFMQSVVKSTRLAALLSTLILARFEICYIPHSWGLPKSQLLACWEAYTQPRYSGAIWVWYREFIRVFCSNSWVLLERIIFIWAVYSHCAG